MIVLISNLRCPIVVKQLYETLQFNCPYQHRSIFVQEIKEDDRLTESSPENGSGRKSDHVSFAAPEGDVVLEGQEVEEEVHGRHGEGDQQQDQVGVHEEDLVAVRTFYRDSGWRIPG